MLTLLVLLLSLHNPDVRDLGSEDYRTRIVAFERLERAGVFAMPSVSHALRSDDLEVKRSAERLMEPFLCDLRACGRRTVVLVLVYAPAEAIVWDDLRHNAWSYGWIEEAVTEYALARKWIDESDRQWYYTSEMRLFWRGEHLVSWIERIRRAAR